MTIQERANEILRLLKKQFPHIEPPLHHSNVHELLFATILSAQTTDAAVNKVTPILFAKYPTIQAMADGEISEIAEILKTIGFHNSKAKFLKSSAQLLVTKFGGKVPDTMSELMELPGVARKVASVVLWQGFGKNDGFTVDTHVIRLANWFGLTESKDPKKIEQDLIKLFPREEWGDTSLRLILLGRSQLPAKKPAYIGTVWEPLLVNIDK